MANWVRAALLACGVVTVFASISIGSYAIYEGLYDPPNGPSTWVEAAQFILTLLILPGVFGRFLTRAWMGALPPLAYFAGIFLWHTTFAKGGQDALTGDFGAYGAIIGVIGFGGIMIFSFIAGRSFRFPLSMK